MFESTTDTRTRQALQTAHTLRGQVVADAWAWLFGKTSR